MMVNLASVDEETDNEAPAESPTEASEVDETEDKVRVDRRKLEQMLQVNGDGDGPSAEEFFSKIMLETNTRISWPSKLKIGAKSKKDPHIKIFGSLENVKKAKELVVAVLESKANRVTLKMDVSHTDHSHIIGRRGQTIKKVMEETGCHIHFPDSNRGSTSTEKSNQVSIAGQPEGVEKARTRIRELLPLVIMFEVPYNNTYLPMDPLPSTIQSIAQRYDVTFVVKGRSQIGNLVVVVRGSQDKVSNIQDAIGCLFKYFTGRLQIPNFVTLQFDIAPQHHLFVVGHAGCNIKQITDVTGTKIEFSDSSVTSRKGTVTISGSINAVVQARGLLVNSLPMLLMFDLKEEEASLYEAESDKLTKLMGKFKVAITIKPKLKQTSKSVVIKSKESNSQNMYLTRLEILGTPMDPQTTQHPPFTSLYHQSPELPFFYPGNGIPWYHSIGKSPFSSPLPSPTSCLPRNSDSPVPLRTTPSPPRFPPGFEPSRQHRRSGSFNNLDFRDRTRSDFSAVSCDSDRIQSQRESASDGGSPTQFVDQSLHRRNSEPTPIGEPWPSGQAILEKSNRSMSSVLSSSSNQKYTLIEGTKNATKGSHLANSHESTPISSANVSFSSKFDALNLTPLKKFVCYEEQRDKANELMSTRKIIQPQVRTPTDQWSGLHLSQSTPDGALRKPMAKGHADARRNIPTTEEHPELDETQEVKQELGKSIQIPSHPSKKGLISAFSKPHGDNFLTASGHKLKDAGLYAMLKTYGVENYAELLERQEIDFETFLTLTKEDLKEAGVEPLGARKKMEHAIEDMKKLQERTIQDTMRRAAQNFMVSNPLELNCRSGRW